MIVKSELDEIQGFLNDASNMPGGHADAVYFPESASDIDAVINHCNHKHTMLTVAGAGTGLSGARIPFGGLVLSMAKLNEISSIDSELKRIVVGPGALLADVQRDVESHELFYPPDPTERNCFIGGTVATNSSGARTFKYGPTRNYVTGLKVALATREHLFLRRGKEFAHGNHLSVTTEEGRTISIQLPEYSMPKLKHAAGYYTAPDMDAIDLFIGSEGTLGVFTEIELQLIPLPTQLFSGVIFFHQEDSTLAFVEEARRLSRTLALDSSMRPFIGSRALEFMDVNSLELVREKFSNIPSDAQGGAIWFEQEVSQENEEYVVEDWYHLIEKHRGMMNESWFAIGSEDQRRIREFRHAIPSAVYEFIAEHGQTKLGTDMAVPDDKLAELLAFYRAEFQSHSLRNVIYGHIGNSHLHANMLLREPGEITVAKEVYSRFITKALELGGTVSAEHGAGKLKKRYLEQMYGKEGIEAMRNVKRALDPNGILGIGTMFELQ